MESVESRELIDKARTLSDGDIAEYLDDAQGRMCGLENCGTECVGWMGTSFRSEILGNMLNIEVCWY